MLIRPVDIDLAEHWEADAVGQRAKRFDVLICSRLLSAELVAGESKDDKPLVSVFLIQIFQVLVLAGEAALRSDIDNQKYFSLVFSEACWLVIDSDQWSVVVDASAHCFDW